MTKNLRTILLLLIGIISIGLSIKCFTFDSLSYESKSMYGGDAFTGIQNAAAVTSKNVSQLASITQFGFGSILFVGGLTLLAFGLTSPLNKSNVGNTTEVTETKHDKLDSVENISQTSSEDE